MFIDIAIGALLIASMVLGYRNGFVYTLIRTFEWLFALVLGIILHPLIKTLLVTKTGLSDLIKNNVSVSLQDITDFSGFENMLPPILRPSFESLSNSAISVWSEGLSDLILAILSFLILLFLIRFLFSIIVNLFSKRKAHNSLVNFTDGILGMIFGFISGFILVSVILMTMFPASALLPSNLSKSWNSQLEESHIAYELWNNNLLLAIVQDVNKDN